MTRERIQKVLSTLGYGSRRSIELKIKQGRVLVNKKLASLGQPVGPSDQVVMDGKVLNTIQSKGPVRIIAYNKKLGEVVSKDDPNDRPTIFESLPKIRQGRWISVGRLDINTSGLILLTNNGELANKMMHPSFEVEREYVARIHGRVSEEKIKRMLKGVSLEDGEASFSDIQAGRSGKSNQWFAMVISEGRNREVRRIWESQGLEVSRLKRVRYGNYFLTADIRSGHYKELTKKEIKWFERL
ncbi:MAG: pseudouridine synthase [SAR86 cluster bacterium]|jgi:23S rRNA pseudouridine2605 synthase|nr:pseudouridine synthase [SAR86 cluster bacterium]|tara:strand:- start:9393 stop:10118 length:726 start_codon:yes stop_codon:yes gene_type:complete